MSSIQAFIHKSGVFRELLSLIIKKSGFSLVEDNSILYVISDGGDETGVSNVELILGDCGKGIEGRGYHDDAGGNTSRDLFSTLFDEIAFGHLQRNLIKFYLFLIFTLHFVESQILNFLPISFFDKRLNIFSKSSFQ